MPISGSEILPLHLRLQQAGDEKGDAPGSIPPRTVWKHPPHWVITDSLGFVKPASPEPCYDYSLVALPPTETTPETNTATLSSMLDVLQLLHYPSSY